MFNCPTLKSSQALSVSAALNISYCSSPADERYLSLSLSNHSLSLSLSFSPLSLSLSSPLSLPLLCTSSISLIFLPFFQVWSHRKWGKSIILVVFRHFLPSLSGVKRPLLPRGPSWQGQRKWPGINGSFDYSPVANAAEMKLKKSRGTTLVWTAVHLMASTPGPRRTDSHTRAVCCCHTPIHTHTHIHTFQIFCSWPALPVLAVFLTNPLSLKFNTLFLVHSSLFPASLLAIFIC